MTELEDDVTGSATCATACEEEDDPAVSITIPPSTQAVPWATAPIGVQSEPALVEQRHVS